MNADESAIREVIARWHRATGKGDVDAILPLMSQDVVFLVAGKPPMKGRAAFEGGLRKLLETHRIESKGDVQDLAVSGDLAYCWTLLEVRVVPLAGGPGVTRTGNTMSIFRKQANGSWLLTRDANLLP
jgi:uncharacterized protein (TIGR02246 family)